MSLRFFLFVTYKPLCGLAVNVLFMDSFLFSCTDVISKYHKSIKISSKTRGVTIHLVTIRFVLRYTACDTLHDMIFAIHISDILFIQELSIGEDLGDKIYG